MSDHPPWDDLRVLLAVQRGQSFLAAGKSLGVATSTVARRVDALERALGRRVVHRGAGGARIDSEALALVALAEQMELGIEALRRDAGKARVAGTVKISVSEGFVRAVTRVLARLRVTEPALDMDLVVESRLADVARQEADIAIRIVKTSTPTLVEKSMGRASVSLFASRAYVDRRMPGARLPRVAAAQHDWVGLDRSLEKLRHEQWMREYGAKRFVFRSNSSRALEEAILSGMGIGIVEVAQGEELGLVRLATDEPPPGVDVFIVFHRDARSTPRVRVVVRALEDEIRRVIG